MTASTSRLKKPLPSPEFLRLLLQYNPETGKLFWLKRTPDMFSADGRSAEHRCANWNSNFAGKEAFTCLAHGYLLGTIFNRPMKAHRVIWAIYYGAWPDDEVDHINGCASDNRISNLRDVSHVENGRNTRRHVTNSSGHSGVSWHKTAGKWHARVWGDSGPVHLGLFSDKADATAAVADARAEFGYHPNHGRSA